MIYDLTLAVSAATVRYPGDPAPVLTRGADAGSGDLLTVSHLSLNCHVGTHVDAPAHFLRSGATVDALPLEACWGPAVVLDLPGRDVIGVADLAPLAIPVAHHLLLKTKNSALLRADRFVESYCHLAPEAAAYVCAQQPRSLGFDYYSLDPFGSSDFPAHRICAVAGVPVFVCLALAEVPPGTYIFAGLPLRLTGAEAAPVRAILVDV